jgi:hypothetical protein
MSVDEASSDHESLAKNLCQHLEQILDPAEIATVGAGFTSLRVVPDFLPKALDNFFPEISDKNFLNIF